MYQSYRETKAEAKKTWLHDQSVKLVYFDLPGRGEHIRLLLHATGVPFQDERIAFKDWPGLKPKTPLGSLPYLDVGNLRFCQTLAINRFIASQTGFAGKDNLERAQVDALVDYIGDFYDPSLQMRPDPEKLHEYLCGDLQAQLKRLNAILCKNYNGDGFFVGKHPTWADTRIFSLFDAMEQASGNHDFLLGYPKLLAHYERLGRYPPIAEYKAKRAGEMKPKTWLHDQKVKLVYFDLPGRGEHIRLLLHATGVPFQDERIKFDDWKALKPTTPTGGLPYLEVGNQRLGQTAAITRYIASQTGMAGKNNLERAQVDALVDYISDFYDPIYPMVMQKNLEKLPEYLYGDLQAKLKRLNAILCKNNNGDGFFVGTGLTWADTRIFSVFDTMEQVAGNHDFLLAFPKLMVHYEKMARLPQIADYLIKRTIKSLSGETKATTWIHSQSVKLAYFDMPGRAEHGRLLLHISGVSFQDERIKPEDWPATKPTTPFGQLPYLEVGKNVLGQSITITRYIASQTGMAGRNNLERAVADSVVDYISEINGALTPMVMSKDFSKLPDYVNGELQGHLKKLNSILCKNNNGDGFFVGDKMTWADTAIFSLFDGFEQLAGNKDFLKAVPKLLAHYERMVKEPQIADYLNTREVTILADKRKK